MSVAAEIGAAYVLGKPIFLLEKPSDEVIYALLKSCPSFRIVPEERLIEELKEFNLKKYE